MLSAWEPQDILGYCILCSDETLACTGVFWRCNLPLTTDDRGARFLLWKTVMTIYSKERSLMERHPGMPLMDGRSLPVGIVILSAMSLILLSTVWARSAPLHFQQVRVLSWTLSEDQVSVVHLLVEAVVLKLSHLQVFIAALNWELLLNLHLNFEVNVSPQKSFSRFFIQLESA